MKTIKVVTDKDEALLITNKALGLIVGHKDNSPVVTGADPSYIRKFIVDEVGNYPYSEFRLLGFYGDNGELEGACLITEGSPWYNPNLKIIDECFTVSFKRGAGIARRLSEYLKTALESGDADYVQTGSFNPWCAPMLKNTYTQEGFHIYNQYYLSKEDLNGLN